MKKLARCGPNRPGESHRRTVAWHVLLRVDCVGNGNAFVIPSTAVMFDGDKASCFVVAGGQIARVPIEIRLPTCRRRSAFRIVWRRGRGAENPTTLHEGQRRRRSIKALASLALRHFTSCLFIPLSHRAKKVKRRTETGPEQNFSFLPGLASDFYDARKVCSYLKRRDCWQSSDGIDLLKSTADRHARRSLAISGCSALDMALVASTKTESETHTPELMRPEELPKPPLAGANEMPSRANAGANTDATLPATPQAEATQPMSGNCSRVYPIDLPTALHLANARNPLVAYTREQVQQSYAKLERANVLWLPSIRPGAGYNHHDGSIQQVDGHQIETSRNDFYSGLGASTFAGGAPNCSWRVG